MDSAFQGWHDGPDRDGIWKLGRGICGGGRGGRLPADRAWLHHRQHGALRELLPGSGEWVLTVVDANHYTLGAEIANSGGYTPGVGDAVFIDLQTSQCAFNPSTVTPYMTACYKQAAALLAAAGLVPWLQFGEILHWFFAGGTPASMALYDANQTAAALTTLGRALAIFATPDDDPSVNGYADANFLVARLQAHIHAIRTAVLASTPTAKFELLWPYDVNYKTSYSSPMPGIMPIGGRLCRYINLPGAWTAPGSDIDRLKIEALAWGTTYRNLDLAETAIQFYATDTTWQAGSVMYLLPWDNGGCPWPHELVAAMGAGLSGFVLWALDHAVNFSWPFPLPGQAPSIRWP